MSLRIYGSTLVVGVLLRVLMGFAPYSGESTPPVFGDYEAQRHWMELTANLPVSEWYVDSELNDPTYWRLDYPPLSAFHEYAMGYLSECFEPGSTSWMESRGYQTVTHRWFMRMSVLVSDVMIYFTAVIFLVTTPMFESTDTKQAWFGFLLLNPLLVYVDHAHFQYNCVAMGLLIWSIGFFLRDRTYLSAMMFTLSILFKQTFAYFAPVFLAIMLGGAFKLKGIANLFGRITCLGLIVLALLGLSIIPFIYNCETLGCVSGQINSVFRRVFPLHRRIFEDYVANLWIVTSPIFSFRDAPSHKMLICGYVSLAATVSGFMECFWALLRRPDKHSLAIGLSCTSLSFYLFSWMVHEKAIVLPLTALMCAIPKLLKSGDMWILTRFYEAAFLSLWQLIRIEGAEFSAIGIGGIGLVCLYAFKNRMTPSCNDECVLNYATLALNLGGLMFAVMQSVVPGPDRYPFLWVLGTCVVNFGTFLIVWRELVRIVKKGRFLDNPSPKKIV